MPNRIEQGRRRERIIHFLTQDELRQLFKVIRSKRDKAIFLVAYRHGLRASEIGLLQRVDMDVALWYSPGCKIIVLSTG